MEKDQEIIDSKNDEGVKPITEADITAAKEAGDLEALAELGLKLAGTNSKLYERAKTAEQEVKNLKTTPPADQKDKKDSPPGDKVDAPQTATAHPDYQELRLDGYTREEALYIIRNGGIAALSDPYVKAGIESIRAEKEKKQKSEEAIPESDPRSKIFKHHSVEELQGKSSAELEKILPHSNK